MKTSAKYFGLVVEPVTSAKMAQKYFTYHVTHKKRSRQPNIFFRVQSRSVPNLLRVWSAF